MLKAMFEKKHETGQALIDQAVGSFDAIHEDLQNGIKHMEESIAEHDAIIERADAHNTNCRDHIIRARRVAEKIRLITS